VPAAAAVVSGALDGIAWRHPVTVIFLSELDDAVVVGDGGVVCAVSVTAATPITAAKLPDQIRFLMLPPTDLRPATIRPPTPDGLRSSVMTVHVADMFSCTCAGRVRRRDELRPGMDPRLHAECSAASIEVPSPPIAVAQAID